MSATNETEIRLSELGPMPQTVPVEDPEDEDETESISVDRLSPLPGTRTIKVAQEKTRGRIAIIFASLFAVTVIYSLLACRWSALSKNLLSVLQILLPVETALLGTIIGFYYGAEMGKGSTSS